MNILNYHSLALIPGAFTAESFKGSSSYKAFGNTIVPRVTEKRTRMQLSPAMDEVCRGLSWEGKLRQQGDANSRYALEWYDGFFNHCRSYYKNALPVNNRADIGKDKVYSLNKSRIKKKAEAFCRLEKSKKFLAFYSISFPVHTGDDIIYKLFNSFLTNLRKHYGLKSYLWVAERQKNGTLHFHLLTNDFMRIKEVNGAMGASLENASRKGLVSWGGSSRDLYNGIDVDSPQFPKRRKGETSKQFKFRRNRLLKAGIARNIQWIQGYLIKYITKNDIKMSHRVSHNSRDISALFTAIVIPAGEEDRYISMLSDVVEDYSVVGTECYTLFVFKTQALPVLFRALDEINELVYKKTVRKSEVKKKKGRQSQHKDKI